MYIGLQVKYRLFLSDFNKTWIFTTELRKTIKYQIARKSVQSSRVVPRGWAQRDTTQLADAFFHTLRTHLKYKVRTFPLCWLHEPLVSRPSSRDITSGSSENVQIAYKIKQFDIGTDRLKFQLLYFRMNVILFRFSGGLDRQHTSGYFMYRHV